MSLDIFLEYLIDSTSSMPIFLDEDMLSELEDSWRWRYLAPDCLENTGLILNWTRDILVEPDVLGIEDSEFNERLVSAIKSETFLANVRATNRHCNPKDIQNNSLFGLEYVLLSGKLGDPEDFLDTNLLPNFDGIKTLYHDWIVLKEREITSTKQLYLSLNLVPLSDMTNTPTAKRRLLIHNSTPVKRRRSNSSSIASKIIKESVDHSVKNKSFRLADDSVITTISPTQMDGGEIQRLMKILEETVEHVEDSVEPLAILPYSDQLRYDMRSVPAQDKNSQSDDFAGYTFFPFVHSHGSVNIPFSSYSSSMSSLIASSSTSSDTLFSQSFSGSSISSMSSLTCSTLSSSPSSNSSISSITNIITAKGKLRQEHSTDTSPQKMFAHQLHPFST